MTPYEEIQWYLRDLETMPRLSHEEIQEVVQQIATHSTSADAARNLLIEAHLRLVVRLAVRYAPLGPALADLIAEGNLALTRASRRFDPHVQRDFRQFAMSRVGQALRSLCAEHQHVHRLVEMEPNRPTLASLREAFQERFVSLDRVQEISDDCISAHQTDPERAFLAALRRTCLESVLQTLTEQERNVMNYRFLLDEQTLEAEGREASGQSRESAATGGEGHKKDASTTHRKAARLPALERRCYDF